MAKARAGEKGTVLQILTAAAVSVLLVMAGVLLFAGAIRLFSLPTSAVRPVNQFIKTVGLFLGCVFTLKGSRGALKGLFAGIIAALVLVLVFAVAGKAFPGLASAALDLLLFAAVGLISGIVAVNVKKDAR